MPMGGTLRIYITGSTPIHQTDGRVKLVLLLVFSVCVFLVGTWKGLGIYTLALACVIAVARLPWGRLAKLSVPLLVILAFIWAFNAFALDIDAITSSGMEGVSAGFAQGWQPVALVGRFGFVPEGCMFALFYAVRILLVLFASFVVSLTTTAEGLMRAFASLIAPLRRLRVPVDDIATMLSIAVRFIPLTAVELADVRNAQASRGAAFETGNLLERVLKWRTVFIPLVVRLFRRADALGVSMEARCYGFGQRTSLSENVGSLRQTVVFLACSALLVAVACLL